MAILPVVLYHAGVRGFSGGFVGVDIFFVISGYLITHLIVHEMDAGQFRFSRFWLRRARRILPAATVVIAATLAAGWFLLLPFDLRRTGQSAFAQAGFVANIYFWQKTGYFFDPADSMPLLHTWSLAVEEQFYFLMPVTLFLLTHYLRRYRIPVVATLLAASFAWSVWTLHTAPEAAFYFLQSRAWELLVGCLTALLVFEGAVAAGGTRWRSEVLSALGALAIACSVVVYDRNTPFPASAAALPCLGTAAIIWSNRHRLTGVGRVLSRRPFVWIGLISYSLYLWHWPMLVYARYASADPLSSVQLLGVLSAAVLLSWCSYQWIETPIRRGSVLIPPRRFTAVAAAAVLGVAAAGLGMHLANGFPDRLPDDVQAAYEDAHRTGSECADAQVSYLLYACGAGGANSAPDVIVWGDSHATKTMPVIQELARDRNVTVWKYVCWPLLDVYSVLESTSVDDAPCTAPNREFIDLVRARGVKHILFIAYWSQYTEGRDILLEGPGKRDPFFGDASVNSDSVAEARAVFRRHFIETVQRLRGLGVTIWIMKEVPAHRYLVPNQLTRTLLFGGDPDALGRPLSELAPRYAFVESVFQDLGGSVRVVDPTPVFCRDGFCRAAEQGRALYSDYHHVSLYGAMRLKPLLEPAFRAIAENKRTPAVAARNR